jgi:hypothetical protein
MDEPIILRRSGETAFAISPDDADQGLRLGIPPPHLIPRNGEAVVAGGAASRTMKWHEPGLMVRDGATRLLTMRD